MVKGETIVSIATNGSKMKRKEAQHKSEGSLLSIPFLQQVRMKTKSNDLPFIRRPFEIGRASCRERVCLYV